MKPLLFQIALDSSWSYCTFYGRMINGDSTTLKMWAQHGDAGTGSAHLRKQAAAVRPNVDWYDQGYSSGPVLLFGSGTFMQKALLALQRFIWAIQVERGSRGGP